MSDQESEVRKLIRLKRYEKPREGYFEDFLTEFRNRRAGNVDAERPSAKSGLSISRLFQKMIPGKWVIGAGIAYATLLMVVLSWPKGSQTRPEAPIQPVIYEPRQPVKKPVPPKKSPVRKPVR